MAKKKDLITRRSTTVYLLQGDDYEEERRLLAAVDEAAQLIPANSRLGDSESLKARAAEFDAFMAEAEKRAETLKLVALPRKKYREIVLAHPPRDGNADDKARGFNVSTCCDDLVPASVDPEEFDTDAYRDEWLEALADGQFSKIYSAALDLNRTQGADPKERLSERLAQTSSGKSTSPGRLG